ncbi:MAG: hypothetical protein MZU79_01905 [Anaerotruncus sp.]|nr:hypothetical protein [Anaerotruncus sp.]
MSMAHRHPAARMILEASNLARGSRKSLTCSASKGRQSPFPRALREAGVGKGLAQGTGHERSSPQTTAERRRGAPSESRLLSV